MAGVKQMLRRAGLAGVDNPRLLLDQVSVLIRSHDDLRRLLATVEPGKREECYRELQARLLFQPKPLEEYMAETKRLAERQRLPLYDPENVNRPYRDFESVDPGIERIA
ncbi:MAG: hypothetical protein JO041_15600, partial [Acidobacteria bacterium]|nr:hypothetical protein [Acidobacteriota bacterium]